MSNILKNIFLGFGLFIVVIGFVFMLPVQKYKAQAQIQPYVNYYNANYSAWTWGYRFYTAGGTVTKLWCYNNGYGARTVGLWNDAGGNYGAWSVPCTSNAWASTAVSITLPAGYYRVASNNTWWYTSSVLVPGATYGSIIYQAGYAYISGWGFPNTLAGGSASALVDVTIGSSGPTITYAGVNSFSTNSITPFGNLNANGNNNIYFGARYSTANSGFSSCAALPYDTGLYGPVASNYNNYVYPTIFGLTSGAGYYFCTYLYNANTGAYTYAGPGWQTTTAAVPTITYVGVNSVSTNSITIYGNLNANGINNIYYGAVYSAANGGFSSCAALPYYTGYTLVASNYNSYVYPVLSGLTPGAGYYFCTFIWNGNTGAYTYAGPGYTTTTAAYTLTVTSPGSAGTVTSNPAGINCGATCSYSYNSGTSVTLTATPALGYTFAGWSGGGCSGTGTCTVTMNSAQNVTATFSKAYSVSWGSTSTPTTMVTNSVNTATVSFTNNGSQTWTATPNPVDFAYHWYSGSCPSATVVTFDGSRTGFSLPVAPGATVSNLAASITAPVSAGTYCLVYDLVKEGDCWFGGVGGSCTGSQTVSTTINVIATSVLTVAKSGTGVGTVTSNPAGISCGATCSYSYTPGQSVTLTAAPNGTSTFTGWSGGGCSGIGTCTVTMNSAQNVTATFTAITYTLTILKPGAGVGTVISSDGNINCGATCSYVTYNPGASVTLTAAPNGTSTFAGWSGGGCSGTGTCTVTMSSAQNVSANFSSIGYGGTITFYWGNSNQTNCNPFAAINTRPALEVVILSGSVASPTVTKYVFDGCNRATGALSSLAAGSGTANSFTFNNVKFVDSATIPVISNGLIMKAIPLYSSTIVGIQGSSNFPSQGKVIESTGKSGDSARKIIYYESYSQIPNEIFPYSILSQ